jgi:glutamate 5-kinase
VMQLLCTHSDFHNKVRSNAISNTLAYCFKNRILPVINENDTLTIEELKLI